MTGYSLVGAAVIVTAGALGDVLGRRKIFIAGLGLFIASCALIALSTGAAGVVGGRMIQGASGATILACGMSLLSVAASGAAQMKAITLWGAASAAGAALGPLIGGVLADSSVGWQGLFWIDAAVAAACIPLTLMTVAESRDPNRSRSIDWVGTVLIALVLSPVILALSEGNDWGWTSVRTLGCFVVSIVAGWLFVVVERRVEAPIVNLALLRNRILVGSTLAILIVAGTINALMYLVSLYFQDPAALGLSALQAGVATLPAAAGMIIITPFITPLASKIGAGKAVALGFALATAGFVALAFVKQSWAYAAFVLPLVATAVGLGIANGPASSASTASVPDDQVGAASGISNMARYIGAAVAVAAARDDRQRRPQQPPRPRRPARDALASGLAAASLMMAIWTAAGVGLIALMRRHRASRPSTVERAAAAAATTTRSRRDPRPPPERVNPRAARFTRLPDHRSHSCVGWSRPAI